MEEFTESVSFDRRLYAHDITGSIAHAQMLASVGLISEEECQQIEQGLSEIRQEIEQGQFQFRIELEDIHMHIESALIERIGDTGRKLHTGRSRNDQVSTDMRLWVRDSIDQIDRCLTSVCRPRSSADVIRGRRLHLARLHPHAAGPTGFGAPLLAGLLREVRARPAATGRLSPSGTNVLSLGAAALAGTSLPIDREDVARRLGFDGVAANSLDVSSDRDFVVEFAFCLALIAEHLSAWAEEWILWSTAEFNFITPPQAFCTGSSIMPQKVNPDVLELIRGKTARVVGNLQSLLVLIKGLPLAYNRDLQEDKQPLFDSFDTVSRSLELAAPLVAGATLNRQAIAERLDRGHLDATTFMEYLISRGIPQRTAHGLVGRLVRKALDANLRLADLPLEDFQEAHADLDETVYDVLGVDSAVRAMQSYGSTAPDQVSRQVELWERKNRV